MAFSDIFVRQVDRIKEKLCLLHKVWMGNQLDACIITSNAHLESLEVAK
jgi:hypothetical protein